MINITLIIKQKVWKSNLEKECRIILNEIKKYIAGKCNGINEKGKKDDKNRKN